VRISRDGKRNGQNTVKLNDLTAFPFFKYSMKNEIKQMTLIKNQLQGRNKTSHRFVINWVT